MKELKLLSIIILFNLQVLIVAGQTHEIDSLENLLFEHTKEDTFRVNLLNETAWLLYSKDNEKCLQYAKEAEELATKLNYNIGKATSSNVLGIHYYVKGNYPKALEYFHEAILMNEKIGNKFGTASCLNNIGAIHLISGSYEDALESFQKSLKIKEEIKDTSGIPSSYNNIGNVYMELGNYSKAQENYEKSLKLKEDLGDKNGIASSYDNIGLLLQEQGKLLEALEYFKKSLKITEELEDYYDACLTYLDIGNVYFEMKNFTKALDYTLKSLKIASKHEFLDTQKDIRLQFAEIYESTNNYKKAYENYVIYKELSDTLFNEENIKKITGLTYQYQFEKEKQAIELEQQKKDVVNAEEKKRQIIVRNSFIAGFVLMIVIVILVLRLLKIRRKANKILAIQKQKTEGSIRYAQTIQNAILPAKTEIDKHFDSFILFRPKDIVSGDFHWYTKIENYHFIAVVDCTGHGVPGAFMSMIGSRLLSEVIVEQKCFSPNEILKKLDIKIHKVLKQEKTEIQDGMDVCLCRIETGEKVKVLFSGAKRDLLHYNLGDKSLEVINGDRISIGGKTGLKNNEEFNETKLELSKGDILYLTTDGFIDQNNKERKRFGSNEFNELLKNNAEKPLSEQKTLLENALDDWMLNTKQRDDITIVGLKI